jgi:hypothetical protein
MGIADQLYMKNVVKIHMESSYFNLDVGCYEPLMEPWSISLGVVQKLPFTGMDVSIVSD